MTNTAVRCKQSDFLLRRRSFAAFLILVLVSGTAAFAEDVSQPNNRTLSIRATHLLGFAGARNNSKGTLSIEGDSLQFKKSGRPTEQVRITSIENVLLGNDSKQVGGLPMTLAKSAIPYSGGRVVSLFSHKKYDTLTLEYVDSDGGLHGAIFELKRGKQKAYAIAC